jgi:hypothetical protein
MRLLRLVTAAVLAAAAPLYAAAADEDRRAVETRPSQDFFITLELDAGPLLDLDKPLRGASGGLSLGIGRGPLGLGLSSHAAYDSALDSASIRIDLGVEIGGGARIIVGGVLPLTSATLDPNGAALPLEVPRWPGRFGLASRIVDSKRGLFGSRFCVSAEIVYTAYRAADEAAHTSQAALAGAEAFAACIEIYISAALAWKIEL